MVTGRRQAGRQADRAWSRLHAKWIVPFQHDKILIEEDSMLTPYVLPRFSTLTHLFFFSYRRNFLSIVSHHMYVFVSYNKATSRRTTLAIYTRFSFMASFSNLPNAGRIMASRFYHIFFSCSVQPIEGIKCTIVCLTAVWCLNSFVIIFFFLLVAVVGCGFEKCFPVGAFVCIFLSYSLFCVYSW